MVSAGTTAPSRSDRTARERAYAAIRRKIISSELAPGSAVSELALAKALRISRTPIREAIGQLAAEGLIEQNPNRGSVVVRLLRQDIVDLFELREALEVHAVGKAARSQLKHGDLDHLRSIADEIPKLKEELVASGEDVLNAEQMRQFTAHDLAFHTLLVRLSANPRILKAANEARLLIRVFAFPRSGYRATDIESIHRRHCEIVGAVEGKDSERAIRLLGDHIQTSCREHLEAYDAWERERSLLDTMPAHFDA